MRKMNDNEDVGQVRGVPDGGMQGVAVVVFVVVFCVVGARRRRRQEEVARDLSVNDE
jgi:multisubunit Na+/H+ antiporter MnhB subunit